MIRKLLLIVVLIVIVTLASQAITEYRASASEKTLSGLAVKTIRLQGKDAHIVASALRTKLLVSGAKFTGEGQELKGQVEWLTMRVDKQILVGVRVSLKSARVKPLFEAPSPNFETEQTVNLETLWSLDTPELTPEDCAMMVAEQIAESLAKQLNYAHSQSNGSRSGKPW